MSQYSVHRGPGPAFARSLVVAGAAIAITLGVVAMTQGAPQSQAQIQQAATSTSPAGQFIGITPVRVLDTRVPIGVASKAKLGPGQSINVAIAGHNGIPADATAVAINIAIADATGNSYLTIYPTGATKPVTSADNAAPGLVMDSGSSYELGTAGELTVFNATASVNVIIDATGYYATTAPSVTSISPTAGPVTGGTAVTITGTNLTGANAVDFGATAATSFTVVSSTEVTTVSPAEAAGTVDVTVTTPLGTSATSAADQFTYEGAPTVTSISPTAGPVAGGTAVTITGTNLTGATSVAFRTTAATSFTVVSSTEVTAVSPARAAGTVDVTVTTPVGTSATSAADQFTYM